jgi:hypothetical protein
MYRRLFPGAAPRLAPILYPGTNRRGIALTGDSGLERARVVLPKARLRIEYPECYGRR